MVYTLAKYVAGVREPLATSLFPGLCHQRARMTGNGLVRAQYQGRHDGRTRCQMRFPMHDL